MQKRVKVFGVNTLETRKSCRHKLLFTLLYGLLIVYASLFPFSDWSIPEGNPFGRLAALPHHISRKDAVVNVLAYIPFGILLTRCSFDRCRLVAVMRTIIAGFCLSLVMESLQSLLPGRESSLVDLATNSSGAAIGAAVALLYAKSMVAGSAVHRWQERWLAPDPANKVGAGILLIWILSRLSPFVPTFSNHGPIKGIGPLLLTLQGKVHFHPADALVHCCHAAGLALLASTILVKEVRSFRLFTCSAAIILTLPIFIVNGYMTLEMATGYLAGISAAFLISRLSGDRPLIAGMVLLVAGFVLFELKPGESAAFSGKFNWIPFRYHLENTLPGIRLILEGIWPFSAISLLWVKLGRKRWKGEIVYSGVAVFLTVTLLEWLQLYIPGRTPDITPALLAVIGWCWPLLMEKRVI